MPVKKTFNLLSDDIREGHHMPVLFELAEGNSDCTISPHLCWENPPEGTKSFAITCFDPDAPTGCGFWHWLAVELTPSITELKQGEDLNTLGARIFKNDLGSIGFIGARPPRGHGMHRYQFTLWALPVEKLDVSDSASSAVVGFTLNALALAKATLTATYARSE